MASAVPGSIVAVTSLARVSSDQRGKWFFYQRGNIASTSVEGVLLYQNTLTQHRQKKKTWTRSHLVRTSPAFCHVHNPPASEEAPSVLVEAVHHHPIVRRERFGTLTGYGERSIA